MMPSVPKLYCVFIYRNGSAVASYCADHSSATHILPLLEMEAEQKSQSAREAGILVAVLVEAMRERGATSKTSKYQLDGTLKKQP
jgi:hypothetical protein